MIPVLYAGNEQSFLHNGLGRLSDAITCKVTEERNGTFELEMEYPVTGIHFADIAENNIIYAKTEDGGNNQAFIIYKISKPLNGIVTINAQHISYLLNGFIVFPFTAVSLSDAMSKIVANTTPASIPFTFYTDVSSLINFSLETPRSVRNLLGGESGSLLDVYGGYDYKFDNFQVSLLADRGADRGVSIRYGKNLTGLKSVDDATNFYTGIVPYWQNDTTSVYLPEKVVYCDYADNYPYKVIKTVDFSSEWEEAPTEAQLRTKAQNYVASNKGWEIKNNIDVSFVSLSQTEEYKNVAPLERVKLCDTVTVIYDKLGIDAKTKVIKTVYNVLLEKYETITLGDTTYTLAKAIQQAIEAPTITETNSFIANAVQHATKLIQGGLGGHVVFNTDGNGEPQEILIMDTDDINTAVNVIRMNLNGIGFSHTGYSGTYETAWTIDGHFVADYIDTGNLNGALISAGTIQAGALSVEAKKEIQSLHNYISDDIFTDITVWQYGTVAPYYDTIGGKTYIVLDGTGISAFDTNYYMRVPTNTMGGLKFDVHMKWHVDTTVTVAQQRLPFVNYTDMSGSGRTSWYWLSATTLIADDDHTWDVSFNISVNDADKPSYFGIYAIPNCKLYIEELSVTSTVDTYATAGMTFTNQGLDLLVQEVGTHSYLPYDLMSNSNRWDYGSSTYGYAFSYDTVTISGKSVDVASLDGHNAYSGYSFLDYHIDTDIIGQPPLTFKFKYALDSNYTPSSNELLARVQVWTGTGWLQVMYCSLVGGTTYTANTEYTFERTVTPSYSAAYFEKKSQVEVVARENVTIYIYDMSLTSDESAYKSASLTYTADGLNSVVQAGSIISTINQSAESVSIEADKINLTGDVSLKGEFQAFDTNDLTNYIDMTHGAISVYNQNDNVFTIASTALLGNRAGIFFGDATDSQEMLRRTHIDSSEVSCPWLYNRMTGTYEGRLGATDTAYSVVSAVFEGTTEFYQNVYFRNDESGYLSCSMPAYFYGNVCNSGGGVVFVSDRRKKKSIKDLVIDKAKSFIMGLKPRQFKFKEGTSNRYHHGFIAQEVKEVMGEDWGVYCEDKETDFIGLRYDELIADMVAVIQDQEKRIEALERGLHDITNNQP